MTDKSLKGQFLVLVQDEAANTDYRGMEILCANRPDRVPFGKWVRQNDWTLPQIVAFFRWHTCYIFGGIDVEAFEEYWLGFRGKVKECLSGRVLPYYVLDVNKALSESIGA